MKTLNIDTLSKLTLLQNENEPDVVLVLCALFKSNSDEIFQRIDSAYRKHNFELLAREAHSLKSGSSTVGAEKLAHICQKIERFDKNKEEISDLVFELGVELKEVYKHVDKFLNLRSSHVC